MTDDLVTEARKGGPCAELGDRCRAIEAASGCFCAAVADRIEALTADNARLRKALTFYADEENYKSHLSTDPCGCCTTWDEPIIHIYGDDSGHIARAALTGKADQAVAGAALDCACGMGFGPCKDPECKAPILTGKEPSHE
jgi:hypothetical protein